MRNTCCIGIVLALVIAGCGAPSDEGRLLPLDKTAKTSIVVLDPAGRLFDMEHEPEIHIVDGDATTWVTVWPDVREHVLKEPPPDGADVLVLARGCRPARVPLRAGRNYVRLEAGHRVRITMLGDRPDTPEGVQLGISLERSVTSVAGVPFPDEHEFEGISAAAFDDDATWLSSHIPIPVEGTFDVLVPASGPYKLWWIIRAGNHTVNSGHEVDPVFDVDTGSLSLTWPTKMIEDEIKRMTRNR